MELATLSSKYGNFFAPAFSIRLGRDDLTRDLLVAVSQVEVDLVLGASARFTFTLVNCYSAKAHAFLTGRDAQVLELLKFGAEVSIGMGYGDAKTVPVIATGVVTEITTNFPESGSPELTISGYDHAFPLTIGKNARTWTKALDSDAAREIASFHNLSANIEATKERHPQIEQNQESDFEFLKKLADRNHFELFVDEKRRLHFRKPNDSASAVVRLVWGEGLISFKPEANLAGQIAKVEVYGWDPKKKEKIVGVARAGEESGKDSKGRSAGERLKAFIKDPDKQPVLRLRQPVFTQAEAEKRASAALNERAKEFLKGEAEAIGLPDIRPDQNVQFDNLGAPFSKTYYIQQATHKIDSNGYRTRFKVKETAL
ncbi:phage late control D family protein [Mesorhizobium japonicum]|uniref:Mlr6558 protein n=1 Tax=Mesorhizobium japonicum (strain LMG 29417 / CECT 9101 / MAFF 303099) TaxID=266835 RepID=Q988X1_RHILO|nr:phage late control D family protein [Mesorhizobium japonicum]BAB52826.1 mlr6558 [Mesorhizobium japonicum MAFF 303099]